MNHLNTHAGGQGPLRAMRSDRSNLVAVLTLGFAALVGGCGADSERSDAYGNFETTEILVSSEASGRLLTLDVDEGMRLEAGETVGHVDTVQLGLQRGQLLANRSAMLSRIESVRAQIAVLTEQKRVAMVERDRLVRLLEDHAATEKQLDDIDGQISILDRQVVSTRTQSATIRREMEAVDAQIEQLQDRIDRSMIVNPVAGTVLIKFAEAFELTGIGKPLYKIADLQTMYLRAYVSGDQLPDLALGQLVTVLIDQNRTENQALEGEVSWIASEAEFTPKLIQTKEERVDLVYAFKVRVDNPNGIIKIGMPGEVRL